VGAAGWSPELSSVGDELLQLAPAYDPPAGFESRVLARLTEPPRRRSIRPLARRWQWLAAAAAAVVLAAALGGAKGTWGTAPRRPLGGARPSVRGVGRTNGVRRPTGMG